MVGLLCLVLAAGACGAAGSGTAGHSLSAPATTTPGAVPESVAGGPGHCENPKTVQDLTLGAYIAVEATIVAGSATSEGAGSIIPLSDVKILWQAAPNNATPRSIEADVPLAGADLVAPAGRYILLLGSGHAGHWYLTMGPSGAFAYLDPQGTTLTQLCVTYTATAQPAAKAPGSISRTKLLALLKQAPLPDATYSPPA